MPKVSIIVPVYNTSAYLRRCMDALTGQTLEDIEIIAVNDGSTDDSPAILGEYEQKEARQQQGIWGYAEAMENM